MTTRLSFLYATLLASLCGPAAAAQGRAALALQGTVTDSIRHAPLVGATVIASQTSSTDGPMPDLTAKTDTRGRFAIALVKPGVYLVTVEHPWLDSTGLGVPARSVSVTDQPVTVNLAVPSGATIRAAYCPIAARDSTLGLVAGYVKDVHSDHPVAGARVVFAWDDFDVDRVTAQTTERRRLAAATSGPDGTFRICGLPVERTLLVQAQVGAHEETGAIEAEVPASGVLVETLRIDASPSGTTSITGEVRKSGSARTIAGAHVHLYGATGEVESAPDGSFRLPAVPFGTQSIEVTALGYYPRRYAVDVRPGTAPKVTIPLLEMAPVLDSVRVIAKRQGSALTHKEFDERSAHGPGQYITEDMIAKAQVIETAELMQQVRGFYVMSDTVYSSRGVTELSGNHVCQPTLYIDGNPSAGTMNDVVPSAIHGIEIYASSMEVPPQYKASSCGAILIWTK
ncbi:MAG TPA: carboxypeptidase-like regulatory domain-containing protein [Gemmatimonadaceae bacterium]|nr:carboxypeptidase-like regulatory domain-containing protein [Gemmatimonadaceae bacterium]